MPVIVETVEERILANVVATLEGITKANGYLNDIVSVSRTPGPGGDVSQFPSIEILASSVPSGTVFRGADDVQEEIMSVTCRCWYSAQKTEAPVVSTRLRGDVVKALYADFSRGQNAHYTTISGITHQHPSEGGQGFVDVIVQIPFSYDRSDPTVRR